MRVVLIILLLVICLSFISADLLRLKSTECIRCDPRWCDCSDRKCLLVMVCDYWTCNGEYYRRQGCLETRDNCKSYLGQYCIVPTRMVT